MFKNKEKLSRFVKRQVAKVLAVVMAFGSFASTGMAMSTAYADSGNQNDNSKAFIDELVRITAAKTPYVWGGQGPSGPGGGVDCRGFINLALRNTYGTTVGYLVDESGNAITDGSGSRIQIEVAAWDALNTLRPYVGKRVCIEGNGHKSYYRIVAAGQAGSIDHALDINYNGATYSSIIAYACQFPGTIVAHNGHYGVGIGAFNSKAEVIEKYPGLSGRCSGTQDNGDIVRFSDRAYAFGNSYNKEDYRYWFGKTSFLNACNPGEGIRADNWTTTGKDNRPAPDSTLTVLMAEAEPPVVEIEFEKIDAQTKAKIPGAEYGIYKDRECREEVTTFLSSDKSVKVSIAPGEYFVKELSAPIGYVLDDRVHPLNITKKTKIVLEDLPIVSTIRVKKVDAHSNSTILSNTKFKVQEYNGKTKEYIDLVELSFDNSIKAFVLNKPYTNIDGVKYSDNALHYSQTNGGYFKLVETTAQDGYINDNFEKVFNINDGNLSLIGQNSVKNVANLALLINKTNHEGQPLAGAHFRFEYDGKTYKGETDTKGQLLFENIPEGDTKTGTLYEVLAPEGYEPSDNYLTGQKISLSKDVTKIENNCFRTTINIVNRPESVTPPPAPQEGKIVVKKVDLSRFDSFEIGVPDAKYTLYKDEALTEVAENTNGEKMENLATNEDGEIVMDKMPLGIYYLKEVEAPNGYATQLKVFAINLIDGAGNKNNVVEVNPHGVGDMRQTVTLGLQKKDDTTNNPVEGAVYALYAGSDLKSSTNGKTVKSGTLLGYYKTDKDGNVDVDRFGTPAFDVDGHKFDAVVVKTTDNEDITDAPLVNGNYYFTEVYSPNGYLLDETKINIDATWKPNNTEDDVEVENGVVSAGGATFKVNPVGVKEKRQSVKITLAKKDADLNSDDPNEWYNLNDYNSAVDNKMVASLKGAKYQLVVEEDVVDMEDGHVIPAETPIGVYETNENGILIATEMNMDAYSGHRIPNGKYYFTEIQAPQGYAISNEKIHVDATWTEKDNTVNVVAKSAEAKDEILKQPLTIKKISSADASPLENVEFKVYNVAKILEANNLQSTNDLPWNENSTPQNGYKTLNREKIAEYLKNVEAEKDDSGNSAFRTGKDGVVTTGNFIYGDYIVFETEAPAGYKASDAIYIQLPWVEANLANTTYYIHDVQSQPDKPYTQVITNTQNNKEASFVLNVVKIDSTNDLPIFDNPAQFELIDSNGNKVVQGDKGNPWETDNTGEFTTGKIPVGEYTLKEKKAPNGYITTSGDIKLSVTDNSVVVTLPDGTKAKAEILYNENGMVVRVYIPNTPGETPPTPPTPPDPEVPENKKASLTVVKVDSTNDKPIMNNPAQFELIDREGNKVVQNGLGNPWETDNTGKFSLTDMIPLGTYTLKEVNSPAGYVGIGDITLVVTKDKVTATLKDGTSIKTDVQIVDGNLSITIYVPNNPDNTPEENPTVEFHKTSTVPGGTTEENATPVAIGDTIRYHLRFNAVGSVKDVVVTDVVPKGLTYVNNSAMIDGVKDDGATYNPDTRVITFSKVNATNEEKLFEFDVVVDSIPVGSSMTYVNIANATYKYGDNGTGSINSEKVTHKTESKLTVEKHGMPKTFEGDALDAKDVTVLKAGEEVEYTITAKNGGNSAIKNVVISDKIPDGLKYVSNDTPENVKVWVDDKTGLLTWNIPELGAGETVNVKFTCVVLEQKAQLIVNGAKYNVIENVGEEAPTLPENSSKTNDVVHQVIEFHKTSIVKGGKDKTDATPVAVGDTIIYTLEIITKGNVKNAIVTDALPEGLEYIKDSVFISNQSQENDEWVHVPDDEAVKDGNIFIESDIDANSHYLVKFSAKVKEIPLNSEKFYLNQAKIEYDKAPIEQLETPERDSLMSEIVSHMTMTKIEGHKTGEIATYEGDYDARHHVTVVENGEQITYSITVKNVGLSDLNGVVIRDSVPEFTKFISAENDGVFNKDTNSVEWKIEDLKVGESKTVKFVVECTAENDAVEIRNKAAYAVPNDPENIQEDEWFWTDEVIHQTTALHKTSSIDHGTTEKDATFVSIGSTFTYKITFDAKNTVYGLTVTDAIPKNLTFVPGTATYTLPGGEKTTVNDLKVDKNNTITFPTIEEVPAGTSEFTFDVKVEDVKEFDRDYYFVNIANATVKQSQNSETVVDLMSEQISHKTSKTNSPNVPPLGFNPTSETIVWSMIAIVSAFAMCGFGYYGFVEKRKKK